jgi:hypothetical protein
MDQTRAEVIVASTLYLISSWVSDPSACACRLRAIVAHLERMMRMDGLDPVLRATAIQLHEHWLGIARKVGMDTIEAEEQAALATQRTWH